VKHNLYDTSSLWVSIVPLDGHPNAKAHAIIAEAVRNLIDRDSLLAPNAQAQRQSR